MLVPDTLIKKFTSIFFAAFLLQFLTSCNSKQDQQPLFQLMDNTGIHFVNEVKDQELNNSFLFRNFYNGGGVGLGDINNDGLADVMLTSNMGENKLYLNKGDWKFDDITVKSGMKQDSMWSAGIVMVDINNDSWLDMYVCNSGNMTTVNNKLFYGPVFCKQVALVGIAECVDRHRAVRDNKTIEIAIEIVIKERCLRCIA